MISCPSLEAQGLDELITLAKRTAARYDVPGELICAIVEQESGWHTWAMRYEPDFFARYVEPLVADGKIGPTEATARSCSWGLMQVMGEVAREHGFTMRFLSQLCDPGNGLEIGCKVLAHKLAAAEGNVERALLLWNGGGNKNYPAQVLGRTDRYKTGGTGLQPVEGSTG